jgi:hypothetical protein
MPEDVDPIGLMRAIYGLSTAGSADDGPARREKSSTSSYGDPVLDKRS